jgi:hypothetical protein
MATLATSLRFRPFLPAPGEGFTTESWYRYEGPVVIAALTWKINNLKPKASRHEVKMDFDSGLDH